MWLWSQTSLHLWRERESAWERARFQQQISICLFWLNMKRFHPLMFICFDEWLIVSASRNLNNLKPHPLNGRTWKNMSVVTLSSKHLWFASRNCCWVTPLMWTFPPCETEKSLKHFCKIKLWELPSTSSPSYKQLPSLCWSSFFVVVPPKSAQAGSGEGHWLTCSSFLTYLFYCAEHMNGASYKQTWAR